MSNTHILLFLLLCFSNIANVYNSKLNHKSTHNTITNNSNKGTEGKNTKKNFFKKKR